VAVVDIQSEKAARVADTINTEFGEGMAYGFGADATSEQSVMALARGVDDIFGRTDLLVYSAGIAKAAFISDFELGDLTARCRSIWWAISSAPASFPV
jgi:sorbitol-6-phosphate 2-dehydrogenase